MRLFKVTLAYKSGARVKQGQVIIRGYSRSLWVENVENRSSNIRFRPLGSKIEILDPDRKFRKNDKSGQIYIFIKCIHILYPNKSLKSQNEYSEKSGCHFKRLYLIELNLDISLSSCHNGLSRVLD